MPFFTGYPPICRSWSQRRDTFLAAANWSVSKVRVRVRGWGCEGKVRGYGGECEGGWAYIILFAYDLPDKTPSSYGREARLLIQLRMILKQRKRMAELRAKVHSNTVSPHSYCSALQILFVSERHHWILSSFHENDVSICDSLSSLPSNYSRFTGQQCLNATWSQCCQKETDSLKSFEETYR